MPACLRLIPEPNDEVQPTTAPAVTAQGAASLDVAARIGAVTALEAAERLAGPRTRLVVLTLVDVDCGTTDIALRRGPDGGVVSLERDLAEMVVQTVRNVSDEYGLGLSVVDADPLLNNN